MSKRYKKKLKKLKDELNSLSDEEVLNKYNHYRNKSILDIIVGVLIIIVGIVLYNIVGGIL